MKKKLLIVFGVVIVLVLLLLGFFKEQILNTSNPFISKFFLIPTPGALTKVKVSYTYVGAAKPEMAVAIKNKIFEKYGLAVEINEFTSGDLVARSLIGGKVDIVIIAQTSYIKAAAAGANIKSVGIVNSNTRWYLVSRVELKNIKSYCTTGITTEDYLRGTRELKKSGVDVSSLKIVNLSSPDLCLKTLASEDVDSMAVSELSWESFKIQNKETANYKIVKKLFGKGYLKTPATIIVMNNTLKNKKLMVENFSKALVEANYWLKTHSEAEIEKVISGVAKITPSFAKTYSRIVKGQLEDIQFIQKLSEAEVIRKANEDVAPALKNYDVKNFLSTVISDELTKQGFLQKYGF